MNPPSAVSLEEKPLIVSTDAECLYTLHPPGNDDGGPGDGLLRAFAPFPSKRAVGGGSCVAVI